MLVDERFKSATDREDIKQRVYSLNSNLMRMDEVDSKMSLSAINVIKTISRQITDSGSVDVEVIDRVYESYSQALKAISNDTVIDITAIDVLSSISDIAIATNNDMIPTQFQRIEFQKF